LRAFGGCSGSLSPRALRRPPCRVRLRWSGQTPRAGASAVRFVRGDKQAWSFADRQPICPGTQSAGKLWRTAAYRCWRTAAGVEEAAGAENHLVDETNLTSRSPFRENDLRQKMSNRGATAPLEGIRRAFHPPKLALLARFFHPVPAKNGAFGSARPGISGRARHRRRCFLLACHR
jgi:hypothetical protein